MHRRVEPDWQDVIGKPETRRLEGFSTTDDGYVDVTEE